MGRRKYRIRCIWLRTVQRDRDVGRSVGEADVHAASPKYEDSDDERYPHMRARKRFGRIAIASSDAAASASIEAAIEQGHRAVTELG
jgi:hypothetical protein